MNLKQVKLRWLLLPVMALLIFAFTEQLSKKKEIVESAYAQSIYPIIARILSNTSSLIPFSLDDLLYVSLILTALLLVGLLIFKIISFKKSLKIIVNVLATIYILFYLFWGFNYFREDVNSRIGLNEFEPNTNDFITVFEQLIKHTNQSICKFDSVYKYEIDSLVECSYESLSYVLKIDYPMGKRHDKGITFSSFFAKAGVSGYYGPFFNEVHVNKKVLPFEYPFILAHEKAHQLGITSEAEANFYAWLVCSQSNSKQLRYSANLALLPFFINQGYKLTAYPEIISKLDEQAKTDFNRIRIHWKEMRNEKVDKAARKANDVYLKTNKIKEGIDNYRGVTKHVMNFSLDSAFQKKYNLQIK